MTLNKLILGTLIGLLFVLLTHFVTSTNHTSRVLMTNNYTFPDTAYKVSVVTEKYELEKRKSNIRFDIHSDVSNSWFELSATLVNSSTGKEYSLEKGVEYYYGYSGGESWKEGSQDGVAYFTRIPRGTYFLQLEGMRNIGSVSPTSFSVEVTYDVTTNRNLWWAIALFFIWPGIRYFRSRYLESARWSNSPFSTQNHED